MRPGTASDLSRNSGTQKSWMTSFGVDPEVHRAVLGQHERVRAHLLARVAEAPGELLAGHVHHQLVRAAWPRCRRARSSRRSASAETMMNGIVTQMTSSRVLPWIGAPSRMSPGLGAELDDASRWPPPSPARRSAPRRSGGRRRACRCRPPALDAFVGNQSIQSTIAMPTTEATRPMAIIRAIGCASPSIRGSSWGSAAGATGPTSLSRSHSVTGARVYWTRRSGGELAGALAEGRRRRAVVAPEGLGELGRLAVARRPRPPRRPACEPTRSSAAACSMRTRWSSLSEAGLAALGEGALELAAGGGDRVGDGPQREVRAA